MHPWSLKSRAFRLGIVGIAAIVAVMLIIVITVAGNKKRARKNGEHGNIQL